jgi:hypothetical protein
MKTKRPSAGRPPASERGSSAWDEDTHLQQLVDYVRELIPIGTAADAMGLQRETVLGAIDRQPRLARLLKIARAEGLIDLQRRIAAGAKSWQSLARIGESVDPEHWVRVSMAGRPKNDASVYSRVMAGKRKK